MTRVVLTVILFLCVSGLVIAQQSEQQPLWIKKVDENADFQKISVSYDGHHVAFIIGNNVSVYDKDGKLAFTKEFSEHAFLTGLAISEDARYISIAAKSPWGIYLYDLSGKLLFKKVDNTAKSTIDLADVDYLNFGSGNDSVVVLADSHIYDELGRTTRVGSLPTMYSSGGWWDGKISYNKDFLVHVGCSGDKVEFERVVKKFYSWGSQYFDSNLSWSYAFPSKCSDVALNQNGNMVAVGTLNGLLYYFNGNGSMRWSYTTGGPVLAVHIINHTSGPFVLGASEDGFIYLLDTNGTQVEKYAITQGSAYFSGVGSYVKTREGTAYKNELFYYESGLVTKLNEERKPRVVLLANSIDFNLNSGLVEFLGNRGFKVIYSTGDNFEQYKNESNIVILGGPDAYDGVGEIVRKVLLSNEQNQVRERGNRMMFVKTNTWNLHQKIFIIAGSGRTETQNSANENKAQVTVN